MIKVTTSLKQFFSTKQICTIIIILCYYTLSRRETRHFWLIGIPYGLSVSIYGLWSALFDVNLKHLVSEVRKHTATRGFNTPHK